MRAKVAKKIRRQIRREVRRNWAADLGWLQSLPLGERVMIAVKMIFGVG